MNMTKQRKKVQRKTPRRFVERRNKNWKSGIVNAIFAHFDSILYLNLNNF